MKAYKGLIITLFFIVLSFGGFATTYYLNPIKGNDKYSGLSPLLAFQSLERISSVKIQAGDSVLLCAGTVFYGGIELRNIRGKADKPIVIGNYNFNSGVVNEKAIINAKNKLNGILLKNCSFIELENIQITAKTGMPITTKKKQMRCGVLVKNNQIDNYEHIYLKNLHIENIYYEKEGFARGASEVKTANGSQNYGWGIRFINTCEGASIRNIKIEGCVVKNVAHTGIKFTGKTTTISLQNIQIINNKVLETGGPGIQMSGVANVLVRNNLVNYSGSNNDSRKWGRGSGLWTWGSNDVLIEKNFFMNANGPGDSAGAHIDYNCRNIVLQYNLSANNAGGFCEILGNNYNCAYRYNISVNDGYRVKGKNGAFQEGKIFWLSGYNGKRKRKGPFNSYFYNNTIYVKKGIQAKIAIDKAASGILIANNIFCIEGETTLVLGDQYNPEKEGASKMKNVVFSNNLYLKKSNWPKETAIQDAFAIYGKPNFMNAGGGRIKDYIMTNSKRIKNRGIEIDKIEGDTIGLSIGLKVNHDILGNEIIGAPDLGAIELK